MINSKINHYKHGEGLVKSSRNNDYELYIEFNNGFSGWVRYDELVGCRQNAISNNDNKISTININDERLKFRKIIEAFRLGIVPYSYAEEITIGRQNEIRIISNWLNNQNEATIFILGGYGCGKTHLLHHTIEKALSDDFAVAWVELDPNEVQFYKPKRVYNNLIRNFRYISKENGHLKGFREFVLELLANGAFKDHIFFNHLKNCKEEYAWQWIEGEENVVSLDDFRFYITPESKSPRLVNHETAANIYCYLISSLGFEAKKIGLKGFLLVFDEVENINTYSKQKVDMSLNFLIALINTAMDNKDLLRIPSSTDFIYSKLGLNKNIPFCYGLPTNLKIMLSFPEGSFKVSEFNNIQLEPLSDQELWEMFNNICYYYNRAYNFEISESEKENNFQKSIEKKSFTRMHIKSFIEILDLLRYNVKF